MAIHTTLCYVHSLHRRGHLMSCWPSYVPSLTARTVGRLTPKVLAAALIDPPFSRKILTASTPSEDSTGGLPPVLPSAAARFTPALIRSRMESRSHSAKDKSMCSIGLEVGCGAVVPGVQALRQGADVDPLVVEILDGPQTLGEVPGQPVDPRDHYDVAGSELSPELLPGGPAHVPARSHVGEDAALGGQPALAPRLGDPDVAEYRGVHVATSPHGNQTHVCQEGLGCSLARAGQL